MSAFSRNEPSEPLPGKVEMGLSMQEKRTLTREASRRYQQEKTRILDELVKTTGYNRKYALHVLANWGKTTAVALSGKMVRLGASPGKRKKGGGRKPACSGEFAAILRAVWIFFWYRCGKILAPFVRDQIGFFGPHFA
jgi:hypothetical protein